MDEWVAAITEEYHNLQQKGVFIEVECPMDTHVHEGHLVFAEKVRSDGEVTRKKARLVTKGFMEVWGEDYWHTYSPTLGHDTLFSCLAYTAIGTCLDIMYAIHSLSQFSIAPGPVHLMALKRVYHYLNGMQDLGITFNGNQLQDGLVTYSDSDWAGDLNSCRSISGYVFILCGAIVAWSTKKQM